MNNLLNPKRVLLKLSGEALQGKNDYGIEVEFIENLAKDENLPIFVCSIDKLKSIGSEENFGTIVCD